MISLFICFVSFLLPRLTSCFINYCSSCRKSRRNVIRISHLYDTWYTPVSYKICTSIIILSTGTWYHIYAEKYLYEIMHRHESLPRLFAHHASTRPTYAHGWRVVASVLEPYFQEVGLPSTTAAESLFVRRNYNSQMTRIFLFYNSMT